MEYRTYKKNGNKVSLLGFGAMRLPTLENGEIDEERAQKLIDLAYDSGVNYYDTAYMYHDGKSQSFLGKALKKYDRESFFITNKMPVWMCNTKEDVDRIFNEQLKLCGVEYFDYYLIHSLDSDKWDKCLEWNVYEYLDEKRKQGIIKNLGFSFHHTPDVLERIVNAKQWDFAQIQLNYLDWEYQDAKTQYEILEKNSIPCIVMEPVHGGALAKLPDEAESVLKEVKPENSIASWAIRYCASLPNVLTVLSGMSTEEQVVDNLKTMTNFEKLSDEEQEVLQKALHIYKSTTLIPCTNCKYCIDCPANVNIPEVFRFYNDYKFNGNPQWLLYNLSTLGDRGSENCVGCGACLEKCPQKINIPEQLSKITELSNSLK